MGSCVPRDSLPVRLLQPCGTARDYGPRWRHSKDNRASDRFYSVCSLLLGPFQGELTKRLSSPSVNNRLAETECQNTRRETGRR